MHETELPDWAVERGRALNWFRSLDLARTALVNVDMQNVFMAPGEIYANANAVEIVDNINALSGAVRAGGGQVIWTRQTHTDAAPLAPAPWQYDLSIPEVRRGVESLKAGTPSQALHPAMDVRGGDLVLDKHRYGALACPDQALGRALEAGGIEMVIITGTLTNCCCESTARGANMAGYKVIVVSDACAAVTDAEHNAALLNLRLIFADVKTTAEVLTLAKTDMATGSAAA